MKTTTHAGAGCLWLACWGLFLFCHLVAHAQQEFSDACWSGTWTGTYAFTNTVGNNCPWTNSGNITITISVNNGVVTGSGSQDGIGCINFSNCVMTGYGTRSGAIFGTVSGNTIILTNNWVNSCDGQNNAFLLGGTLKITPSGCTITGDPDLTLQKRDSCESCMTNTTIIRVPTYTNTGLNQNPIVIVNGPEVIIIDGQRHTITIHRGDPFADETRPASAQEINSVVGRALKEAALASPNADWNGEANHLATKLLTP
jgi:hypothetical protein